jgi:hypothetical protein
MAQKALIARAGRGLLDLLTLLLRGVGAVCAAFGSFVLFVWSNEGEASDSGGGLTNTEKKMRDLDPGFEDGGFYRYKRH